MDTFDSFATHSLRDVTHHVFCSAVIAVPAAMVVKNLRSFDSIKRYGADGGVISCCVMENLVPVDEVGVVRRCTLQLQPYAGKLIREKLIRYTEYRHEGGTGGGGGIGDDIRRAPRQVVGEMKAVEMCMEYLPCEEGERYRSPFDSTVEEALQRTHILIRVSTVTRTPHRCFVEMNAECVLRTHQGRHINTTQKLQDVTCQRAVTEFWRSYLDAQLFALEQHVCKEAFPEVEASVDEQYRTAFSAHEEVLCDWAVEGSETMPRHVAVDELETVLVWWARVLEAYKHQKTLTEIAEARVTKMGVAGAAPTRHAPLHFNDGERLCTLTRRQSDSVANGGGGGSIGGTPRDVNNLSSTTQTSQSHMEMAIPGALLSSGSRGTGTAYSELSRQSMSLPRDRRHTAVPKKSFVSASSVPGAAMPAKVLSPVSSFQTPPSATAASPSNVLQFSVLSHGSRRKQLTAQPPHLLQHAQRCTSNANSLSSSVSRYSVPNPTAAATVAVPATGSENTGLFFSQLFRTLTYSSAATAMTAPAGGLPAVTPAQRPQALSGAAAAAAAGSPSATPSVSAMRTPTATTTATSHLAASAAPQTSPSTKPTAAAISEVVESFQPDMVRHLFSLTGVLQEDVARRIFASLCTLDDTAAPRLNAEGLKSVVRYLDLCGLREGGALARGDAAAYEEAYRAEVQRCYYQQNTPKGSSSMPSGANTDKAESSTLTQLTALREASRRKGDEAVLDKLVKSLLSRFAFQRKGVLNYEEFHLALLYLWNN